MHACLALLARAEKRACVCTCECERGNGREGRPTSRANASASLHEPSHKGDSCERAQQASAASGTPSASRSGTPGAGRTAALAPSRDGTSAPPWSGTSPPPCSGTVPTSRSLNRHTRAMRRSPSGIDPCCQTGSSCPRAGSNTDANRLRLPNEASPVDRLPLGLGSETRSTSNASSASLCGRHMRLTRVSNPTRACSGCKVGACAPLYCLPRDSSCSTPVMAVRSRSVRPAWTARRCCGKPSCTARR